MNEKQIRALFKAQLHSRQIGYDVFWFENQSVAVIIHIRSTRLSINLPYLIDWDGSNYIVSTFDKSWSVPNDNQAISIIVRHLRTQEVKFSKFSQ